METEGLGSLYGCSNRYPSCGRRYLSPVDEDPRTISPQVSSFAKTQSDQGLFRVIPMDPTTIDENTMECLFRFPLLNSLFCFLLDSNEFQEFRLKFLEKRVTVYPSSCLFSLLRFHETLAFLDLNWLTFSSCKVEEENKELTSAAFVFTRNVRKRESNRRKSFEILTGANRPRRFVRTSFPFIVGCFRVATREG
ncbi:hypothetical protein V1477_016168 [Vespula maculifrons]|uniref:Uncharacterized protein n=1 Tax=Vespula maculifrons TaxID=7453 RepID=A0ABD2BC85_VESMC